VAARTVRRGDAGIAAVGGGHDDEYGLYPQSFDVYQSATMAKVFVSAEGGDHLDTFVGATPAAVAMRAETVRFLDAALALGHRRRRAWPPP